MTSTATVDAKPRLIMLARVPRYGEVKSRLAEHLGKAQALRVHVELLQRNAHIAAASGMSFELHYAGNPKTPFFGALADATGALLVAQSAGDIGERMLEASRSVGGSSLIIGSDCGALSVDYLRAAAAALAKFEVVLGTAEDGGYVLIGQQRPTPELFNEVSWGTNQVMLQTRMSAKRAGIKFTELAMQWDIDTIEDWRRYTRRG